MHLTNASVQKTAEDYDKTVGCKWGLQDLKMYLISKHGIRNVDELFFGIQVCRFSFAFTEPHIIP